MKQMDILTMQDCVSESREEKELDLDRSLTSPGRMGLVTDGYKSLYRAFYTLLILGTMLNKTCPVVFEDNFEKPEGFLVLRYIHIKEALRAI